MKEIIAGNLTRYRKGLNLSQERLAELTGITRQSINNYEKAKTLPDSKTLSALARALGVTLDDLLREANEGLLHFRFRAHNSFIKRPQFAAQVLRMLENYTAIEQAVDLQPYAPETISCHQFEGNEKLIEEEAAQFRHRLGLGDAPIANLFEAVEQIGLKVLRAAIPIKGFFGLSACSDHHGAFVLVNTHSDTDEISIERQLFTLAHEIGHLIFHRGEYQDTLIEEGTKEEEESREKVANYFASHLLVPQAAFECMHQFTKDVVKLKRHFRVSYVVILMRLAEKGDINFAKEKAKICAIYKNRNGGSSLKNSMELPPTLKPEEFPENERYKRLISKALGLEKISVLKAAELLNTTVERLRQNREEAEVYVIP